jgi:soluble lytic murein transglycosylase-like protein
LGLARYGGGDSGWLPFPRHLRGAEDAPHLGSVIITRDGRTGTGSGARLLWSRRMGETSMIAPRRHLVLAAVVLCASAFAAAAEPPGEASSSLVLPATIGSPPAATTAKRTLYLPMLEVAARQHGVPAELVDAVAFAESGYDPSAIGTAGEVGIMQVMPSTAAMLGFNGTRAQLAEPETNIRYGVEYLAGALRLAGGDICRTLMKYRAGHGEETLSARSLDYCRRVRQHLAAIGSPLADQVGIPVYAIVTAASQSGAKVRRAVTPAERSRLFWAAHHARVRAITAVVHARWARMAQRVGG